MAGTVLVAAFPSHAGVISVVVSCANVAETVWESGRFDAASGPPQLLFGHMYEDPSIELAVFRPGGRVLCIASAGCTALKLASRHEVVAVDVNPVQIAYVERRIAGAGAARGVFEQFMGAARTFAPLVGWRRSRLHAFLDAEDPEEQIDLWRRHFDTWRFRVAFDGLLSLLVLRAIHASPRLGYLPRRLGAIMRGRMERCFARHANRDNPYARGLLLGRMSDHPPPPQARDIRLVHADAADYLERQPAGSFDGLTLSNSLDGASAAYRRRLIVAARRAAAPGAVVVLRSFGEPAATLPTNRAADDRSMLWGIVDARPAIALEA